MPAVLIRNLDASLISLLKARAEANGRSLEAELRDILARAARVAAGTNAELGLPAPPPRPMPFAPVPEPAGQTSIRQAADCHTELPELRLPVPSREAVAEFKETSERDCRIELTDEEAWDHATRFLQLVYLASTPPPGWPG